jgi:hypothetical protein
MTNFIPDDWPEAEGELPPSLEYLLGQFAGTINKITGQLKLGSVQLTGWYNAFRALIIRYLQAAFMAGQNNTYIGETEAGYIYEYVKTQVDFLNNFRLVIGSADEWNAQWEQRAESYARGVVSPYWKGRTKMLPLPAMPGDMSTDCGQRCACLWDIRVIDEKAGDYDCYWKLNASRVIVTEHCQDCETRAVSWNPLRIRGGELQATEAALPEGFTWERFREYTEKHLPGQHDQKTHGRRGGEIADGENEEKSDYRIMTNDA